MIETGYLKFNCHWIKSNPLDENNLVEINHWRNILYSLGLIGVYPNGIGFGNISMRHEGSSFIISGTATGEFKELTPIHYTQVINYNFAENILTCRGPIKASSESLTHAAIYESDPLVNAVIHVHSYKHWQRLINIVPTTSAKVEYGTPAMADEIKRLYAETQVKTTRLLVMGGHEEGIISFGSDLQEAGKILEKMVAQ